jgi:uncharacterized membrane protein/protein-disulfide isomerase
MKFFHRNKPIVALPYPYYFMPVFLTAMVGFFDSIYLAVSHYRNYTDIGYQSFCAISKSMNCDTVSQSPYSIFLSVPVPIWGIIGYAFLLVLILYSWPKAADRKRVWSLLMVLVLAFCVYAIILAGISTFLIHSYCIMCILSYAVSFLILYYCWIIRKRFYCERICKGILLDIAYLIRYPLTSLLIALFFSASILMIFGFLPKYWMMNPPALSKDMPRGVTEDGHPWIGAEHPELEIIEFTDYMCFQCKKMHFHLRRMVQKYPDKIRLVHRHFPMDQKINPIVKGPFHDGAAKLALIALYGVKKEKFWEINDALYQLPHNGTVNIRELAEKTGVDFQEMRRALRDKRLWRLLWKDVSVGIKKYGLTGTPGFIINNQVYFGQIPPDVLKKYFH